MAKRKLKKKFRKILKLILLVLIVFVCFDTIEYIVLKSMPRKPIVTYKEDYYTAQDFGFINIKSKYDYNENGIDDYTDILLGAKKYAELNPKYISKYYAGGYPPETEGVCTDTIWWSLMNAGYYLKDMMSYDIRQTAKENLYDIDIIDDNIDFRRVGNQETFLKRYIETLTPDIEEIGEFMPGDIITFDDSAHIAIISDKRNAQGVPYVIQNSDEEQTEKEEDVLLETPMTVTGHYRFTYTEKLQKLIDQLETE